MLNFADPAQFTQKLPQHIINQIDFKAIWDLKPAHKGVVKVFNKETKQYEDVQKFRSYMSYLNTPEFDDTTNKSYMAVEKTDVTPEIFNIFIDFAKTIDVRYNQLTVNWYEPDDYIEMHRDCTAKMISKDAPILTINLNESNIPDNARDFIYENAQTGKKRDIKLNNNIYFVIANNATHRHGVGKGLERRISLTFRMMKE